MPAIEDRQPGPATMPDALEKVAAALGVSQATVSMAMRHVKAVARSPELGEPDISPESGAGPWPPPAATIAPDPSPQVSPNP